jgi:hypothetical protein
MGPKRKIDRFAGFWRDCESVYSMAWKVLALQAHLKARPEISTLLEISRVKFAKLVEDPHQTSMQEDSSTWVALV